MKWTPPDSTDAGAGNGPMAVTNSAPTAADRCPMWYKKSPRARNRLVCQLPNNHTGAHKYDYSRHANSRSTSELMPA